MGYLLTFLNLSKMSERGIRVQGATGKQYGNGQYDRDRGGHIFQMPLEEWLKYGADIVRGSDRPLSKWQLVEIEPIGDETQEQKQAEEIDELRTRCQQLANERDAAIRAVSRSNAPEADDKRTEGTQEKPTDIPEEKPTDIPKEKPTDIPEETPEEPEDDAADDTEKAEDHKDLEARIETLTNFRKLRKLAIEAGVPGADKMTHREDIAKAWLAHAKASEPSE